MSATSNPALWRNNTAGLLMRQVGAAVKGWWGDYVAWRIEQAAIAQLNLMSDRELHDIGVARSQIEAVVKGTMILRAAAA